MRYQTTNAGVWSSTGRNPASEGGAGPVAAHGGSGEREEQQAEGGGTQDDGADRSDGGGEIGDERVHGGDRAVEQRNGHGEPLGRHDWVGWQPSCAAARRGRGENSSAQAAARAAVGALGREWPRASGSRWRGTPGQPARSRRIRRVIRGPGPATRQRTKTRKASAAASSRPAAAVPASRLAGPTSASTPSRCQSASNQVTLPTIAVVRTP